MGRKSVSVLAGLAALAVMATYVHFREKEKGQRVSIARIEERPGSRAEGVSDPLVERRQLLPELKPRPFSRSDAGSQTTSAIAEPTYSDEADNRTQEFTPLTVISPHEVPNSVLDTKPIGRRFRVSPSTEPHCVDGEDPDCRDEQKLNELSQEPRDLAWAPQAEDLLRSLIHQRNPGFSIRNVECRLVTCALEVESLDGLLNPRRNLQPADWRAMHAKPFAYRIGLENDALGRRVTVTLWFYERIR